MSLRSVNLNLLPILQALLRERNLSRAAATVGLTQPAISAALNRLREVLGDPLLVRQGRGMVLTLRAQELIEPVEQICAEIEAVLATDTFDPALTSRRFVIASADYAVVTLGPILVRLMEERSPLSSLHFVDIPHPSLEPHPGEVDLFIVPELLFSEGNYPPLRRTRLIEDEFVTVVGASHPLATVAEPTGEQLLAQRYAVYHPALSPIDASLLGAVTGRAARGRHVVAQIQQFSLLPMLVQETGCAAIMPRRIADYMGRFAPIVILPDGPLPLRLDLALAWYGAQEADRVHHWFRRLVIDNCSQLRAPNPTV